MHNRGRKPNTLLIMSETILAFKDAAIFQKESLILKGVSVEIKKGEFVYLIGKTGSGKSSFMKTLYGDIPLREGDGNIVDFDLKKLEEKEIPFLRRKLGIVFQDFKLLPVIGTSTTTCFSSCALPVGAIRKNECQDRECTR